MMHGAKLRIMLSSTNILVLLLGIVVAIVVAQDASCPCQTNTKEDAQKTGGDLCTKAGVFPSKSICYTDDNGIIYAPYDYYQCIPYGKTFLLARKHCLYPWTIITRDPSTPGSGPYAFFSAYDPSTGGCTRPLPKPPAGAPTDCDPPVNNP